MSPFFKCSVLALALAFTGCTPNERILNSSNERPPEPSSVDRPATAAPPAGIDADVAAMKTADFNFIYVFRRKDAAPLDASDRAFMNANLPYEINRKKISDGGQALVIGSNFRLPAENFKAMKERFAFEDFSKPESEIMPANANSNGR